ncbi:transposase [Klebsiella pneumoniae]|uniref:Transposase n=1 Tax=Klebsiella pneumoniae TaxID=573 RepID=A0A2X1QFH3_KLEPN|nr:transposase [Klebsiella pneumoniae]
MKRSVLLPLLLVSLKTCCYPARPAVKTCPVHDHRHRKWRHLDTCQFTTVVEADVPRIMCPDHGCQTLPVPWAGPGSRYTLLFESFVISWLKISTTDAVRKQLRLSWNAVDNIMQRAVRRGLARRKAPQSARHLCVDEVAFKKDISTSPSSLIHRARRWNSGMIAVLKVWRVTSETWVTARLNPSKPCRWI